jgi:hypothetical protein
MGEELGQCTSCFRKGRAKNLMVLLEQNKPYLVLYYCPTCYPIVKSDLEDYGRDLGFDALPPFYKFIPYPDFKKNSQ